MPEQIVAMYSGSETAWATSAKGRDRRQQLHHDREQYDWNEDFQSPSHDRPQELRPRFILPFNSRPF